MYEITCNLNGAHHYVIWSKGVAYFRFNQLFILNLRKDSAGACYDFLVFVQDLVMQSRGRPTVVFMMLLIIQLKFNVKVKYTLDRFLLFTRRTLPKKLFFKPQKSWDRFFFYLDPSILAPQESEKYPKHGPNTRIHDRKLKRDFSGRNPGN